MGRYTGIIIVSDLDGTFWSKVPESYKKNICAIEKFKAEGGIFTFATGRDFYSLKSVISNADNIVNAPVITSNGAGLYDTKSGKYIINAHLNISQFREFIKSVIEKYPEIGVRFSENGMFMTPEINDMIKFDLSRDNFLDRAKEMPLDEISGVSKCVIIHTDSEILDDVQKMGRDSGKDKNFYFAKSYDIGLEVVNRESTKGKTAQELKKYLNMPCGVLYAVGDYYNDADLISSADVGACPQNAVDEIKAISKIITKSCDEGAIADLIDIIDANL